MGNEGTSRGFGGYRTDSTNSALAAGVTWTASPLAPSRELRAEAADVAGEIWGEESGVAYASSQKDSANSIGASRWCKQILLRVCGRSAVPSRSQRGQLSDTASSVFIRFLHHTQRKKW